MQNFGKLGIKGYIVLIAEVGKVCWYHSLTEDHVTGLSVCIHQNSRKHGWTYQNSITTEARAAVFITTVEETLEWEQGWVDLRVRSEVTSWSWCWLASPLPSEQTAASPFHIWLVFTPNPDKHDTHLTNRQWWEGQPTGSAQSRNHGKRVP